MSVVAHTMVNVEIDLARSTLEDYEPGDSLDTFIVSAGGKSDDVDVPDQSPEDIASVALAFPHSGDEAIITIAGVGLEEGDSWRPQNVAVEAHNP